MALLPRRRGALVCLFLLMTGSFLYFFSQLRHWDTSLRKEDHPWGVVPRPTRQQEEPAISTTATVKGPTGPSSTSTPPRPSSTPPPSQKTLRLGHIPAEPASSFHEDTQAQSTREDRRDAVREAFRHSWSGYKTRAWLRDELAPLTGGYQNTFGGWAATLIDSLDTLWILGLREDFEAAAHAVAQHVDFSRSEQTEELNVFETTIRYLGGLLGAYEISDGQYPILLEKAVELGNMLYAAFDTPNRMPVTRWDWRLAAEGNLQEAAEAVLVSELASLTLEFTRLAQLSKDARFFDAVHRITNQLAHAQNSTKLPGMWPIVVDARSLSFAEDNTFTLGGMSDSLYEYLPKEYMLLGGLSPQYRTLYEKSLQVIKKRLLFRPMTEDALDILYPGNARVNESHAVELDPKVQHLGCFAGGMIGIGAKIFDSPQDLPIARKLVDGCIWAYESMISGIMPEILHAVPCPEPCHWDREKWYSAIANSINTAAANESERQAAETKITEDRLPPGVTAVDDRRYILRPEAIESVFILYRITGDRVLQDKAWIMFQAIQKHTRTAIAHAAIDDVTVPNPPKADRMESFWLAETSKYFYLIFSEVDLVSLDDYVL
ncbi:MAG: hypothetical protein M1816_005666 [Peltula sp. TS41687]|nr:MAG: hypothetical protein M1816_005666 [Peltula sp. TS41687]